MLVNLLAKRNFFIQIFIIALFFLLGATNFETIFLNSLQLVGLGLTILSICIITYVDLKNEVISKNSYSTWFYMLSIMPCLTMLLDYKLAGSLLLITYVVTKLIYYETDHSDKFEAFDIGVFLGFAILLTPPLYILGIIIFFYFLTLRGIDRSILTLAILGFLVPILVFIQISYLLDFKFLVDYYHNEFLFDFYRFNIKQVFLIPIVILGITAFINYLTSINKEPVHIKRIYLLIHLLLISVIVTNVLYGGENLKFISFFAILLMMVFTKYMVNKKAHLNWLKETILWGYLICMLFYNFYDRIPRIFSFITEVSF